MTDYQRVYVFGGTVAHLIHPSDSPNSYALALCKFSPNWPWTWMGTGSQDEYDAADSRPLCKTCEKRRDEVTPLADLLADLQRVADAVRARREA